MDFKKCRSNQNDDDHLAKAYERRNSRNGHSRRSPISPPIAFQRDSHRSRHNHSPPFHSRPIFRRGRPPFSSRFSTRGRPHRIPYHSRPDISPPRPYRSSRSRSHDHTTRAERSPRSPQPCYSRSPKRRSYSPLWAREGRGGVFRGSRKASRRLATIGNFGRPIYHKPDYEVSPDRTGGDAPIDLKEVAEHRDELFEKMMQAKRSEKLDEYYRLRDLLNEFDRRNPNLAYKGSGREVNKRRNSSSGSANGDEQPIDRKRKKTHGKEDEEGRGEELEEVDCSEFVQVQGEGEEIVQTRRRRGTREQQKDRHNQSKRDESEKTEHENEEEKQKNDHDEEELDYDDKSVDGKEGEKFMEDEFYEFEEEEEEINFDLLENGMDIEDAVKIIRHSLTPIETLHEHSIEKIGEENVQAIPLSMFRQDFLPLLQKSLANGLLMAGIVEKCTDSVSYRTKKGLCKAKGRTRSKLVRDPAPKNDTRNQQNEQATTSNCGNEMHYCHPPVLPSLLEMALTKFISIEVKQALTGKTNAGPKSNE